MAEVDTLLSLLWLPEGSSGSRHKFLAYWVMLVRTLPHPRFAGFGGPGYRSTFFKCVNRVYCVLLFFICVLLSEHLSPEATIPPGSSNPSSRDPSGQRTGRNAAFNQFLPGRNLTAQWDSRSGGITSPVLHTFSPRYQVQR